MRTTMTSRARIIIILSCLSVGLSAAGGPSPALLVLDKTDNTLVIVDTASLKPVGRVPAGEDPHEVIVSEDGKTAYVSNYGAGRPSPLHTISVIDLAAQKALPPIDLAPLGAPHGLALSGGKVYFTAEASKVVGSYDPSTKKVDWVLGTGQDRTHMVALSSDRNRLFTTNVSSGTVSILERGPIANFPTGRGPAPVDWHATVVPVGRGAEGFDVSPDGKELWVANAQ